MTGNAVLDDDGNWVPVAERDMDLVDDPYRPGQKVRRYLSTVWPTERFAAAAARKMAAMAGEAKAR